MTSPNDSFLEAFLESYRDCDHDELAAAKVLRDAMALHMARNLTKQQIGRLLITKDTSPHLHQFAPKKRNPSLEHHFKKDHKPLAQSKKQISGYAIKDESLSNQPFDQQQDKGPIQKGNNRLLDTIKTFAGPTKPKWDLKSDSAILHDTRQNSMLEEPNNLQMDPDVTHLSINYPGKKVSKNPILSTSSKDHELKLSQEDQYNLLNSESFCLDEVLIKRKFNDSQSEDVINLPLESHPCVKNFHNVVRPSSSKKIQDKVQDKLDWSMDFMGNENVDLDEQKLISTLNRRFGGKGSQEEDVSSVLKSPLGICQDEYDNTYDESLLLIQNDSYASNPFLLSEDNNHEIRIRSVQSSSGKKDRKSIVASSSNQNSPRGSARRVPKKLYLTKSMKGFLTSSDPNSSDLLFETASNSISEIYGEAVEEDMPEALDEFFDLSCIGDNDCLADRLVTKKPDSKIEIENSDERRAVATNQSHVSDQLDESTQFWSFSEDFSVIHNKGPVENVSSDFEDVPDILGLPDKFNNKVEDPEESFSLLDDVDSGDGFLAQGAKTVENYEAEIEFPDEGLNQNLLQSFKSHVPKEEIKEEDLSVAWDDEEDLDEEIKLSSDSNKENNDFKVKPKMRNFSQAGLERLHHLRCSAMTEKEIIQLGITGLESFSAKSRDWGDGTELDEIVDLPVEEELSLCDSFTQRRVQTVHEQVTQRFTNAMQNSVIVKSRQKKLELKKQMSLFPNNNRVLIQNLNHITSTQVGKMKFNTEKLVWEGNETDLRHFPNDPNENHGNAAHTKRPALISNLAVCEVKYQNNMIFDPTQGKWVGNEDETADWDFLEEDADSKQGSSKSKLAPKNCSLSEFKLSSVDREKLAIAEAEFHKIASTWYLFLAKFRDYQGKGPTQIRDLKRQESDRLIKKLLLQ